MEPPEAGLAFSLPLLYAMDILTNPHVTHPGLLIAIGGAEDKTRERVILRYFLEAAGGSDASIVVLATASEVPETGERYADLFYRLHADSVEVLRVDTREHALEAGREALDLLEYATGLFLTGGSQLKFSSALGGTQLAETIRRRHAAGMVVAGTSAGAAVLSEHMIALGDSGGTPRRRLVHMAPGPRARPESRHRSALPPPRPPRPPADGAFLQSRAPGRRHRRGHRGDHRAGAARSPSWAPARSPWSTATRLRFNNSHAVLRGQPIAMMGLKVDFLTAGCRYDLERRMGIPPPEAMRIDPLLEEELAEEEGDEVPVGVDDGD